MARSENSVKKYVVRLSGEERAGYKFVARPQRGAAGTTRPALALPDKPSIAVLPFENMSGDPEQDYFADGMVEDIITANIHFRCEPCARRAAGDRAENHGTRAPVRSRSAYFGS